MYACMHQYKCKIIICKVTYIAKSAANTGLLCMPKHHLANLHYTIRTDQFPSLFIHHNFTVAIFMNPTFAHTFNPQQSIVFFQIFLICMETYTTHILHFFIIWWRSVDFMLFRVSPSSFSCAAK